MKFHLLHSAVRTATIGLLVPFCLWGVTIKECPKGQVTPESYTWNFPAEANHLFDEFEFHNHALIDTSDQLLSFTRAPDTVSWRSHAAALAEAKEHVNRMNEVLCRLEQIKSAVEPWQATLIDKIHTDAILDAVHVEAAIRYLNDNETRVEDIGSPVYDQQIEVVYRTAKDLNKRIDASTHLAAARARVRALEMAG